MIQYKELYSNIYNLKWPKWQEFLDTVKKVEDAGSRSYKYKNNLLMHGILFLNNYLMEEAVRKALKLDYLGDDHEVLEPKAGDDIPDFIDKYSRETYELKCRYSIDEAFKVKNWHNADYRLFYSSSENNLYIFNEDNTFTLLIENFRAPYVNQKKYPYSQELIRSLKA